MKPLFFIGLIALAAWGCSTPKTTPKSSAALKPAGQDSTEYEIVIIDMQFDHWYLVNYNEAKDRTNEYYRGQNLIAVPNWNDHYRAGRYSRVIDSDISYQPGTEYGIEVNRKLYWYFRYAEEVYGIRLFR